jgi:hypothetical protein
MAFERTNPDQPPTPPIRGVLRTELVRDLALGAETHAQLAEKYGRSTQAVHQFAQRNRDEIRRAKQALVADPKDEYAGVAIAKKWYRVADADQDLAHIEERLQDPNLTDTQRKGYLNLKSKLRREVAEERGELPSRIAIESDKPLLTYEIRGIDMDKVFAPSATGMPRHSSSPVPEQSFTPEPGPEPSPAPEPEPAGPMSPPVAAEPESSATPAGEMRSPEDRAYLRWLNS